jgi:hypothetical protein
LPQSFAQNIAHPKQLNGIKNNRNNANDGKNKIAPALFHFWMEIKRQRVYRPELI